MNDLSLQLEELLGPKGSKPPPIAKLRTTHHELARLLALGLKDVDISRITGYSQSRICILKNDPLFKELLAHYMGMRDSVVVDVGARMQHLSVTALEIMQERLLDDPDGVTMKDLQSVAELTLDRTGYGTTTNVNVDSRVTVRTLDEIKAIVEKEHRGRVLPRGQGVEAGDTVREAEFHPQIEVSPGGEGEGN